MNAAATAVALVVVLLALSLLARIALALRADLAWQQRAQADAAETFVRARLRDAGRAGLTESELLLEAAWSDAPASYHVGGDGVRAALRRLLRSEALGLRGGVYYLRRS